MTLMIVDLCCSLAMAICGLWLLTERSLIRLIRLCAALVAIGGIVNVMGMAGALYHLDGFAYTNIWPGEVIIDVGAAALMLRWTWRMRIRTLAPTGEE